MKTETCKNCGGEYGLHHFQTNQCPVNGREAPLGRKQEYKTTVFEAEQNDKAAETQAIFAEYEKINLAQAQQIAALRDAGHEVIAAEARTDYTSYSHRWNTIRDALNKLAVLVVPTGQTLPADK
jgi:hypothetical protein